MAPQDIAPREKRCKTCDETKPLSEYYRALENRDGHENRCKQCKNAAIALRVATNLEVQERRRERQRAWQKANRELHAATQLAWARANHAAVVEHRRKTYENNPEKMAADRAKRRARLAAAVGTYDEADVRALRRMQNGKCAYCRKVLGRKFDVDHIIPLSRGGTNEPRNLQLTCGPCNGSKGAKDPLAFAKGLGLLV